MIEIFLIKEYSNIKSQHPLCPLGVTRARLAAKFHRTPTLVAGTFFHIAFFCLHAHAAVKIPVRVRSEVFPVSGLGKNQENIPVLITASVISGVRVHRPQGVL